MSYILNNFPKAKTKKKTPNKKQHKIIENVSFYLITTTHHHHKKETNMSH